jgi:AcrR family transcriptional regulator
MAKSNEMRRLPKQTRGEERIAAILQAATEVFQEVGFDVATTKMIAQRANTAIGSLYDFFPNKEAIATRLSEQYLDEMQALYEGVLTDELVHASASQFVDRVLDPFVQYHQTHQGMLALWLQSQDDSRLSAMRQNLTEVVARRTAWILIKRYPHCDETSALRYSLMCMHTMHALMTLAIDHGQIDEEIIAESKTMMRAYLQAVLE